MTRKTATPPDPKKPAPKKRASGTAAPKAKTGRPSSYRAEYAQQAVKLCRLGATDKELADFFAVERSEDEWLARCLLLIREDRDGKVKADKRKRAERRKVAFQNSPSLRIRNSVSARMWAALKGKSHGRLFSRLGYTLEELVKHLQSQLKDGMTWENYGKQWHVDHIKPCAMFNMADASEFSECWALNNLRPLWADENVKKGAKYACA